MVLLEKNSFKFIVGIFSITLIPMIVACIVYLFVSGYNFVILIAALICALVYAIIFFFAYKYSQTTQLYMTVAENGDIIVKYGIDEPISREDIIDITYHKLSSIKTWFMMVINNGCHIAYMTRLCDGKEKCDPIGYPKYKELKAFCEKYDIKLIVK